jgi:hypothetical protein
VYNSVYLCCKGVLNSSRYSICSYILCWRLVKLLHSLSAPISKRWLCVRVHPVWCVIQYSQVHDGIPVADILTSTEVVAWRLLNAIIAERQLSPFRWLSHAPFQVWTGLYQAWFAQLVVCFCGISSLDFSSTLKLEEKCSSETSGFLRTTWCYKPEDHTASEYKLFSI